MPEIPRPKLYVRTADAVTAFQWQPGDIMTAGVMVGWLMSERVHFRHPSGAGSSTTLELADGILARPGDWVVREQRGDEVRWRVIRAEEFSTDFVRLNVAVDG